jgi:hypothetical protein
MDSAIGSYDPTIIPPSEFPDLAAVDCRRESEVEDVVRSLCGLTLVARGLIAEWAERKTGTHGTKSIEPWLTGVTVPCLITVGTAIATLDTVVPVKPLSSTTPAERTSIPTPSAQWMPVLVTKRLITPRAGPWVTWQHLIVLRASQALMLANIQAGITTLCAVESAVIRGAHVVL